MGRENGDKPKEVYLYMDGIVFVCKSLEEKEQLKEELYQEKYRLIEKFSREFINQKI